MSMCGVFSCVHGRGCLLCPASFCTPRPNFGEGNGNPLQCSCLENPRDGGAWWAAVYGIAQSLTRLKRLSRPNLPVTAGISWLPTFAFQYPMMKRTYFWGVSCRRSCRSSANVLCSRTEPPSPLGLLDIPGKLILCYLLLSQVTASVFTYLIGCDFYREETKLYSSLKLSRDLTSCLMNGYSKKKCLVQHRSDQ